MMNSIHSEPGSVSPGHNRLHRSRLAAIMLLLCATSALAEDGQSRVHELTITPAAAPVPALKYQLLPPLKDVKPGNAKSHYVKAGEALQDIDEQQPELGPRLRRWLETDIGELPTDQVMSSIDEHYRTILPLLAEAARYSQCEWQTDFANGLGAKFPPIGPLRAAANGLQLRIRLSCHASQFDEALRDLQTGFSIARHIGNGDTVIHMLSGSAIRSDMVQEIQRMSADVESPNLYWALITLPRPFIDIRNSIRGERRLLGSFFDGLDDVVAGKFSTNLSPEDFKSRNQEVIDEISDWSGKHRQEDGTGIAGLVLMRLGVARDALIKQGFTKEQLNRIPPAEIAIWHNYQEYRARRDELDKAFGLPYWLARDIHRHAEENFEKNPPKDDFISSFIPTLGGAHFLTTRAERQLIATTVIESVRHHLATHDGQPPKSLDDLELPALDDPVTGKPFGYEVNGRTITLIGHVLEGMDPAQGDRWVLTIADTPPAEPASQKPARRDKD